MNINKITNQLNKITHDSYNKIININKSVDIGDNIKLNLIGKGGEGVVYCIDKYAIKFYLPNDGWYAKRYSNMGNEKEMFILKETSKLVDKNVTNTFVKIYEILNIFNRKVVIMDLVDGDLEDWTSHEHSHNKWTNIIFQILYATFVMQQCLKIYHYDMKPKNILFKKIPTSTFEYVIKTATKEHKFIINTDVIFMISDFGLSSTLLNKKNAFLPETIQLSIDNNLDLHNLSILHIRQAVTLMEKTYTLDEVIKLGNGDKHLMSYYEDKKRGIHKKMRKFPKKIQYSMLFRAMAYYVIEKNYIKISDIPNDKKYIIFPPKEIQILLESLSELKGKGTLLNKIIELGNIINKNNSTDINKTFCIDINN